MRESEAKKKYCPFTFNNPDEVDMICCTTCCMAWHSAKNGLGYCKLIDQRQRL